MARWGWFLALWCLSCTGSLDGSAPSAEAGADATATDALDTMPDAGTEVGDDAADTALVDDGPPLKTLTWMEVSKPPATGGYGPRPGVAVGPCFLAVVAGDTVVHAARVTKPGTLDAWKTLAPLPTASTYDTWTGSVGDYAVIGALGPGCFSCYFVAKIDTSTCTVVGDWAKNSGSATTASGGTTKPSPWSDGARYDVGGKTFLYSIGGYFAGVKDDGLVALADPTTGVLSDWKALPSLGGPAMSPGTIVIGDALYLVGGGTDTNVGDGPTTDSVRVANLGADGTTAGFAEASSPGKLPWSARGPLVVATKGNLYAMGGVAGGVGFKRLRRAARATIGASGLGTWVDVPSLVSTLPDGYAVGHLPYVQIGNVVYAIAGGDGVSGTPPEPKAFAAVLE
jgi:hypothetical protein